TATLRMRTARKQRSTPRRTSESWRFLFASGRNGRQIADQQQQQSDADERDDALDTANPGQVDNEELDDDDPEQRRAGNPARTSGATMDEHHDGERDDGH